MGSESIDLEPVSGRQVSLAALAATSLLAGAIGIAFGNPRRRQRHPGATLAQGAFGRINAAAVFGSFEDRANLTCSAGWSIGSAAGLAF